MTFPESAEDLASAVGPWAVASEAYALLTVDVPAEHWIEALTTCRDGLGLAYLDWLSAVDELGEGFSVCAHLALAGSAGAGATVRHLLLRTRVPRERAVLPTAIPVYAGAAWHERETFEMFGIDFKGHPHLVPLLLPDGFEGHPLRKEFVLAARVAKAWPGAKEPGESDHAPAEGARRRMLPPGVPDPNEWGPLKGTLPAAPERPARGTRAAGAAAGAAADRPRRTRSVAAGSTTQTPDTPAPTDAPAAASSSTAAAPSSPDMPWQTADAPAARPRRSRSVSSGSVSQAPEPAAPEPDAPEPDAPEPAAGEKPATPDSSAEGGDTTTTEEGA